MILDPVIHAKDQLVFDVGANAGKKVYEYLLWGARVVAFEPQPDCINLLRDQYGTNPAVTIVPKAVSNLPGTQEFMICRQSNTLSTMSPKWKTSRFHQYRWDDKILVDTITLDEAITTYGKPVFIKVDVEGFEYDVLKSLTQPVYAVCFEYMSEFIQDVPVILNYLSTLGFSSFNFGVGEAFPFLPQNVNREQLWLSLNEKKVTHPNPDLWGDIYAYYSQ